MKIRVHIERLILDGLPLEKRQGPLVQAAIEVELARLLAAHGLSPDFRTGGAMPRVRAGTVQLAKETEPALLGKQIASAVFGGIGAPSVGRANEMKSKFAGAP